MSNGVIMSEHIFRYILQFLIGISLILLAACAPAPTATHVPPAEAVLVRGGIFLRVRAVNR